jgi:hypothetical protein
VANPQEETVQPRETANVMPLDGHSDRSRHFVDSVLVQVNKDRISDNRWYLGVFGIGFLTLAGLFISGYLLISTKFDKVVDEIKPIDRTVIRLEQKLDDLIARIPPVQTPAPRK